VKEIKYQVKPSKIQVRKLSSTDIHIYRETIERFRAGTGKKYYK